MRHGHRQAGRALEVPADRASSSPDTRSTLVAGASLQPCDAPDGKDGSEPWDAMLTSLSIDRARNLLQDSVGILEQLGPAPGSALAATLRHIRSTMRQLDTP